MLDEQEGVRAKRGGYDLTISLTPDQAEALGVHAYDLVDALDTVLVGLAALRTGADPVDPKEGYSLKDSPIEKGKDWQEWLIGSATVLLDRVGAVRAAAIREHVSQGGSYGQLAAAMGVSRTTAQRRRTTVTDTDPTPAEQWATNPAPKPGPEYNEPHAFAEDGRHENINTVDGDLSVPIQIGQINEGTTFTNIATGGVHIGRRIDGDVHGTININQNRYDS